MDEEFELAKKPVWFLCTKDSDTFTISVPKTQHPFRFYKNKPELINYSLDIEFFEDHLEFNKVDLPKPDEPGDQEESLTTEDQTTDFESETETDASKIVDDVDSRNETSGEKYYYSKKELQKLRKSDVRDILKALAPEKSCPVRKENIIKEVLKAQGSK